MTTERLSVPALFLAACAILAIAWAAPARATDPDDDSIIVLTRPIGAERHVGFIINKPTQVSLAKLFPGHEPSKKVVDPVFLGGPVSPEVIFALVQGKQSPGGRSIKILDDLYLAIDSDVVDSVIEKQSTQARFFAGMVLWRPGELNEELKRGLWY